MSARSFTATVEARRRGGIAIKLPFDPSVAWGDKDRHAVTGTVAGVGVRGTLRSVGGEHYLELGPSWCRDGSVRAGARVEVTLGPEGPQVASLAGDIAEALAADEGARRFFDSLATFYRKGYVRWIEEAKRPETRARRIAETIAALKAGRKQR